jgi:hypothetical protein
MKNINYHSIRYFIFISAICIIEFGCAQTNPASINESSPKYSSIFEIKTPIDSLIYYITFLGSGLLFMWLLEKHFNNKEKSLSDSNKMLRYSENYSMDGPHTVFDTYNKKQPIGCFFIAGILIVMGLAGIIGSIVWYLYQLIVPLYKNVYLITGL